MRKSRRRKKRNRIKKRKKTRRKRGGGKKGKKGKKITRQPRRTQEELDNKLEEFNQLLEEEALNTYLSEHGHPISNNNARAPMPHN